MAGRPDERAGESLQAVAGRVRAHMLLALALLASALPAAAVPTPAFSPKKRPYDAVHYRLEVRLGEGDSFQNRVELTLRPLRPLREIELDAYGLEVDGATVDGEKATFREAVNEGLRTGTL